MKIVVALLVFGVIVLIHEMGHFLLAKKNGIYVQEFAIGMGPKLLSFTRNETVYCLKLLPIGGSCMMLGEDESSDDNRAFANKSVLARISVIIAGPLFNFILAFLLAIFVLSLAGISPSKLAVVEKGSPAEQSGLMAGDEIKKINNSRTDNFKEIQLYFQMNTSGDPIDVVYKRNNEVKTTVITPEKKDGTYKIGIAGQQIKGSPVEILKYSAIEIKYWIKATVQGLGMMITGQVKSDQMAGPVQIVNIIGDAYVQSQKDGVLTVLLNMANISILLSANLGVMNLLPIPALDGGRLVFLVIEAIRGKKLSSDKEGFVHFIGFCALMVLMVFVMFNDIRNVFF